MPSEPRENFQAWPVALVLSALLVICLAVLGFQWKFNLHSEGPQTTGDESPARIDQDRIVATVAAGPDAREPDSNNPIPSLGDLAAPAKRADTEPLAASRLPLTAPSGLPLERETNSSHYDLNSEASQSMASEDEVSEAHRKLFDWQDAVLSPGPSLTTIWSEPHLLLARLDELPLHDEVIAWRSEVQLAIGELLTSSSLRSSTATAAIDRLELLVGETSRLESLLPPTMHRYRMHATADTLRRNVVIWRATQQAAMQADEHEPIVVDAQVMLRKLDQIESQIDREPNAESWRHFLETERLWQIARAGDTTDPRTRMDAAARVLTRIDEAKFDNQQQAVMERDEFQQLVVELRNWAYDHPHYESLLYELQRYDAVGRQREARRIIQTRNQLAHSPMQADRELAQAIDREYRGAGMRIAVTETLLNRFLPGPSAINQPVADTIRGAAVRGESQVTTGLAIRLEPDARRLRMGLEASGEVTSNTTASKGPATFYSYGRGRFLARKILLHDGRNLSVWRSDVSTRLDNHLTDFETDFDSVPLINMFARSMALQQHDEEAPLARREVEAKLRHQLNERFDDEIHTRLYAAEKQLKQKVLAPLESLDLEPTITAVRTTETRLIGHYRLASGEQLTAAQTRPWAPSASLISMQLNQATVNNVLDRLELADREIELTQLYEELADTFNIDRKVIPDDLPEGVRIHFAAEEPLRVDFHDNTVSLTLRIRRLSGNGRSFRNFTVRAHYHPAIDELDARLFRNSYVELIGDRLSFGDQIALRGVFSKAFAKQRPISLLDDRLTSHEAFKSLALIQFQVEYGWLALAVGREGDTFVGEPLNEVADKNEKRIR